MGTRFQERLRASEPAYGVWAALDSTAVLEALGNLDLDWVLIDCEHGMASADHCWPQIQALAASTATAIVRLPTADSVLAARVLDSGAGGILVPRVDDAATAERMVAACRYPPAGRRGIGPHRASGFYTRVPEYLASANDEIVVAVQIESREAVERIDEILAVPGLGVVFVGPADLSASLGHFGNPQAPEVVAAVAHVLERAQAAGVPAGYYCGSASEARSRVEQGFRMVNVAHDLVSMIAGVKRSLDSARSTVDDPARR